MWGCRCETPRHSPKVAFAGQQAARLLQKMGPLFAQMRNQMLIVGHTERFRHRLNWSHDVGNVEGLARIEGATALPARGQCGRDPATLRREPHRTQSAPDRLRSRCGS